MTDRPAETAAPMPLPGATEWRERLLADLFNVGAVFLLLIPPLYWAFVGVRPTVLELAIAFGLLYIVVPRIGALSYEIRSGFFCLSIAGIVVITVLSYGFVPTFVGTYYSLLLTAGLLLGPWAMVLVTALGVGVLIAGGQAVDAGTLAVGSFGRDPLELQNWIRVAAIFSVLALGMVLVIRSATRRVSEQYATVSRELARARQLREGAEKARKARLEREHELRDPQKLQAVAALSGGLAHLFNNALTVVQSALESLSADTSMSNRTRVRAQVIEAMGPALQATRDLMVFSRQDVPGAQSIELGPFLSEFAETLGRTVPSDVNLHINTVAGLKAAAHPESLKQLLLNLVLNALDATGRRGTVQLTAAPFRKEHETTVRWAVVAVEDNGSGMDEVTLNQALDPFYTQKDEGTGLGLPVAHTIASQAGGELRLESSRGLGTRVIALLPLETALQDVDPVSLWPSQSLHGDAPLVATDVGDFADEWSDEEVPEPEWRDDVTQRLGRITATIMALLAITVSALYPEMAPVYIPAAGFTVALAAVAGWGSRLPRNVRRASLVGGLWLIGVIGAFRASFDNLAVMSVILIAIGWAELLGRRLGGLIAIGVTAATFVVIGVLRSGVADFPATSISDVNIAENWFRFSPQIALFSLALGTSVVGALAALRRSALAEQEALGRVEDMRKREAEEGSRLLALAVLGTQSERAAAAGRAAGTVAHDLMNAVQSLIGNVEVLAIKEFTDEQLTEQVASLAHAAEYAEALTTQFESIGPAQDSGGEYPACDASQVSTAVVALMRRVLPDRVGLVSDIEPGLVLRISETDLRRIVFNLVSNARDAIENTGTINLSLRAQGDEVQLRVVDDGCGMDGATRARAFEPFFSTKERGRGTGLGLHSTKEIAGRTRGSIELESKPGAGSSFTVSWPAESASAPAHGQKPAGVFPAAANSGVVLLAEDEPLVRNVMEASIRAAGFDVAVARDGDEGLRLAANDTDYVAACIDGIMPGAPSIEVIDCFQSTHPGRPVLLCSGHMPAELAERGLLKSGVIHLAKPFTPSRLRQELEAAIAQDG